MDLGATICTPKKPACVLCPFTDGCAARARGDQEIFPRKAPKKTGAVRRGAAFVVTRGAEVLVRTRPAKGLLGGMTEVPTSDWLAGQEDTHARKQAPKLAGLAPWRRKLGVVTHVFTHFPLELVVYTSQVPARTQAPDGARWVADRHAEGRGAAERHAQGLGAWTWRIRDIAADRILQKLRYKPRRTADQDIAMTKPYAHKASSTTSTCRRFQSCSAGG